MCFKSNRGLARHIAYFIEACHLLRVLRKLNIQHLHAHFGTNPTAVAMLCRKLGGPPYSFTVHGSEEVDNGPYLSLSRKISVAKFVVAVSWYGRSQLCRWCDPKHWNKIHVVHCGVDDLFLNSACSAIPASRRLVCVGRLSQDKGQTVLIEAASLLLRQGYRFELVLVGDGPMRSRIDTMIDKEGLKDVVRMVGWKTNTEVRSEILNAQTLVLTSFIEGLPMVLMESLALRRPVISTYVAGIPELVQNGENGWLVPAGNVSALSEAIRKAIELPNNKLTAMGNAGANRVRADFQTATEVLKLEQLFRDRLTPIS